MKFSKYLKRTLAALLALLMLFSVAACAKNKDEETNSVGTVSDEEDRFPARDFGGKEFRVMYRWESHAYNMMDVYAESMSDNLIQNETFLRNEAVQSKYNVVITPVQNASPRDMLRNNANSGENVCDALADRMYDIFPLIQEGLLLPWNDVVDLSCEWWDQNCVEQLKMGGKNYLMQGDLSPYSTRSYLNFLWYNKTLAENSKLDDPYDDVKDMTWTFEKMYTMVKGVSMDIDGDGERKSGDRFGFLTQVPYRLLTGMGVSFTVIDNDGYPSLKAFDTLMDEKIKKVNDFLKDESNTISIERINAGADTSGFAHIYLAARSHFNDNELLFLEGGGSFAEEINNGAIKYGVLPMPLWDEEQDRYYNMVDEYACAWGLPYMNNDLDFTGTVLEYMAYASSALDEAVYETTLKVKKMQAPEDAEMLEIIFDNGMYELAFVGNVGIRSMLESMVKTGNVSSTYKRNYKTINAKYTELRTALESLNGEAE